MQQHARLNEATWGCLVSAVQNKKKWRGEEMDRCANKKGRAQPTAHSVFDAWRVSASILLFEGLPCCTSGKGKRLSGNMARKSKWWVRLANSFGHPNYLKATYNQDVLTFSMVNQFQWNASTSLLDVTAVFRVMINYYMLPCSTQSLSSQSDAFQEHTQLMFFSVVIRKTMLCQKTVRGHP